MTNSENMKTIKVHKDTRRKLKMVAIAEGITMVELIDRLVNHALPRAAETLYHEVEKEKRK